MPRPPTKWRVRGAVVCALLAGGCALVAAPVPAPAPSPQATQLLATGGYVEARLMRRFAEGLLLVRLPDGAVWLLDPKAHCSWCWLYVGKTVWVQAGHALGHAPQPPRRDGRMLERRADERVLTGQALNLR